MTDMIAQVETAEKLADQLWQERYGEQKPEDEKPQKDEPKLEENPPEKSKKDETQKDEPKPEDFEHKYSVLKGKYDKEVPSMAFQLGEQSKKITELESRIAELSKPKEEKKEEANPTAESEKVKNLRTEYPEVYEGIVEIGRSMINEFKTEMDTKLKKVDQDVTNINEEANKNKKERFLSELDRHKEIGKDWRTINQDPDFIDSLQEIEPYSGRTRHELLLDAFNSQDVVRTARFFEDFKKSKSSIKKDEKPERKIDDGEIHPPKGTKGSEIKEEDKITPTTREELKNFYKDIALGKWNGREKEAEAEERRILLGLGVKVK